MTEFMRTITLETKMTFAEALQYLMDGKCIGIKPQTNSNFLVRYHPKWMNQESPDYILKWNRSEKDEGIRTNQYLEEWYAVIIDHRELKDETKEKLF